MVGRSNRAIAVTLLLGVALVVCLNAHWFCFGRPLDTAEPLRLVGGAIFIFLLPGLLAGELLGLRGRSPLETIAIAATASFTLEIGLVALVFLLAASIQFWVGLLLAISALGTFFLLGATLRGRRLRF